MCFKFQSDIRKKTYQIPYMTSSVEIHYIIKPPVIESVYKKIEYIRGLSI